MRTLCDIYYQVPYVLHRHFIRHTFYYATHGVIITISLPFIRRINPSDTKYSIRINNRLLLFHTASIYFLRAVIKTLDDM